MEFLGIPHGFLGNAYVGIPKEFLGIPGDFKKVSMKVLLQGLQAGTHSQYEKKR